MEAEERTISLHGYPVRVEYREDGQIVYHCPLRPCRFRTSYACEASDAECRLQAYTEMHEHLKSHRPVRAE